MKRERAYLLAQRKEAAHQVRKEKGGGLCFCCCVAPTTHDLPPRIHPQAMLRKHRLREAVEWMKIHNAFMPLDGVLSPASSSGSSARRAQSPAPSASASMGAATAAARPASSML